MLDTAAAALASIVQKAGDSKIRGFSTNISNYNPFETDSPEPFTEGSPSFDESHYVQSLSSALEAQGLPSRFIVDQSRVAVPGARTEWGDWCNIEAGFGQPPTTETSNANVDSIVWIKLGGESDGECGMEGAPAAGAWFDEYAKVLTTNADAGIQSASA
ncbi:glycoside hydrolase family 6 protein [Candidatus Bathyarchaeota archaeon]|nr:glycoside hydrolase family 6 protein [Candidatus Bathyarchaeota archaeon]